MEQFAYTLKAVRAGMLSEGPDEDEEQILGAHFQYLEELTGRGVLVLAGRTLTTGPETFGLVVVRAGDEPAARRIMEKDPAVAQGVMAASLFPFRVALMGDHPGED